MIRRFFPAIVALIQLLVLPAGAFSDDSLASLNPRPYQSSASAVGSMRQVSLLPLRLTGGSTLTFVSSQSSVAVSESLRSDLQNVHTYYTKLFGSIPAFESSVRLMDEDSFYLTTGAPRWTNAMYYKGEIIIPLSRDEGYNRDNLYRSLRHEYTHAVVNSLSDGRAPGWLDEGLAQWAEGEENPALQPALREWLRFNPPVALKLLQGGFTKLDSRMVPAAYAQSLFSVNSIISTYGFKSISDYLRSLKSGASNKDAFMRAFGMTELEFEKRLGTAMLTWTSERTPKNLLAAH